MEQGDPGSDVSYESVASEGGYEPASERGRDTLARIITSSHCVEVFRRVRWTDGAFCCRAALRDEEEGGKANPNDPLSGLPAKLMRFDGAMEAWLEEIPLPRSPLRVPCAYATLNDAGNRPDLSVLQAGNRRATVWYFTLEFLQQLWPFFLQPDEWGLKYWESMLVNRGVTIQSTHVEVGQVHCEKKGKARKQWLNSLFAALQASKWTPEGEARALMAKRRLSHASMSIGDAVQVGGELFVAGLSGFVAVKEGNLVPAASREAAAQEAAAAASNKRDSPKGGKPEEGGPGGKDKAAAQGKEGHQEGKKEGGGKKGKGARGNNGKHEEGEGGGKGRGKGQKGAADDAGAKSGKQEPRAKEPGPVDRADRRKLRAQLQALREQLQGSH